MPIKYREGLKNNAQSLRRSMTKEERHLWYDFLKTLPFNVQRQKMIGNYIVDFYCYKFATVIELDGSQHYSEEEKEYDCMRTEYLNSVGISVIRYSNCDINNHFDSVCYDLLQRFGMVE
ncbi:MAG: endonuclease domain-containing protein [Clostridiales bacterium]|nr:endonuclease domain-containing protein [Clostridiales bacterium]